MRKQKDKMKKPRVDFNYFVENYVTLTLGDIAELNGKKECAVRALGMLITTYRGNIEGCYHGLWGAAEKLDYPTFEAKVKKDIQGNMNYIQNQAPNGCLGDFLKKFSQSIFDEMKTEVMDYASR